MQKPRWIDALGLAMLLGILAYGPLAFGGVQTPDWMVLLGLTLGLLLQWAARLRESESPLFLPRICLTVLVAAAYVLAWRQFSPLPYVATRELLLYALYICLFLWVLNNVGRQASVQIIVFSVVLLATAIAAYGLLQVATESEHVWTRLRPAQYAGRASGTYVCPNHFAGFLVTVLPLALSYAALGRNAVTTRIFLGYGAALIFAGIAASLSRGAWLACACSMSLLFVVMIRKLRLWWLWLLIGLLLCAGTVAFYRSSTVAQNRIQRALQGGNRDDIHVRFHLNRAAFRMWEDAPWVGTGPGHFNYRFPAYRPPEIHGMPVYVHNDYLNVLTDLGIIGAFLGLAAVTQTAWAARRAWKFIRRNPSELQDARGNRSAFMVGAACSLLAAAIHALFDFNLHIPANAIWLAVLLALVFSQLRYATSDPWKSLGAPGRIGFALLLLLVAGTLTTAAIPRIQEDIHLRRAEAYQAEIQRLTKPGAWNPDQHGTTLRDLRRNRIDELSKAFARQPANFETAYALAEVLRESSWEGEADYANQAWQAIHWYRVASRLNPYDPYNMMRIGMCLDWLGYHAAAQPCHERALQLDPNNYYLLAIQGWHRYQSGDLDQAEALFKRSLQLRWWDNWISRRHLELIERTRTNRAPTP